MNKFLNLIGLAFVLVLCAFSCANAEEMGSCSSWHVAQSGYTCFDMATSCKVTLDQFMRTNKLDNNACKHVQIGRKYCCQIGFALFFVLFLFSVGSNAEENGCTDFIQLFQHYSYSCAEMSYYCRISLKSFLSINNLDFIKDCGSNRVVLGRKYCFFVVLLWILYIELASIDLDLNKIRILKPKG
ncbi:hypothetical protein ACTFIR_002023 [Dictyostelium discoideum]